jgi:regulator of sirC expression with transglutaminase-like and TPR domain
MDSKKLHALITLLDDPDVEIFSKVESELLKEHADIVPELEKAWETSVDGRFQKRVENIIHNLQYGEIKKAITGWLQSDRDLLQGVYIVAKYQYPALGLKDLKQSLNEVKKEVWKAMHEHLTSLEKIRLINHVIFDQLKFARNTKNFLAPQNNYINEVLRSKQGNPISLSIIYSLVCQELGIPVYGVNLPKNFILAFMEHPTRTEKGSEMELNAPLFYINPINKGAILGKREIEFFLKQHKLPVESQYLMPCSNVDIIRRLLNNLRFAYDNLGNELKRKEVTRLMLLLDE